MCNITWRTSPDVLTACRAEDRPQNQPYLLRYATPYQFCGSMFIKSGTRSRSRSRSLMTKIGKIIIKNNILKRASSHCCGSGMFIPNTGSEFFPSRIPDPNFFHPGSRIRIKEFKYFNPQKLFLSSTIRTVHPGSGSCFFIHTGYRGKKRHRIPDPWSATLN